MLHGVVEDEYELLLNRKLRIDDDEVRQILGKRIEAVRAPIK